MLTIGLLIAGVLLVSAFFAGAEAALVSITHAEEEALVRQRIPGAVTLARLRAHLQQTVIAIVIGNDIANIGGSILIGRVVAERYGDAVLAIVTSVFTIAFILVSEIVPKSIGIHYAPRIAPIASVLLLPVLWALRPLVVVLDVLTRMLKRGERHIGTEEQILSLVSIGHRAGFIEGDEDSLIRRVFILNDRTAADVMTPLENVVSVGADRTIREAADMVFSHTYSRYPVFGSSPSDVQGIVRSHDILEALTDARDADLVANIMRAPLIVDAGLPCDALLVLFRDRSMHLALVQDRGKTLGLVTLEDVLEELVGEIEDEADADAQARASRRAARRQPPGRRRGNAIA